MFIRFREITARRYGEGERECVGKCKDRPRYYARHGIGMMVKGRTFREGCPMKPICPLVHKRSRLEVSIVETRREGGKVRQKHLAGLGSIAGDSPAGTRKSFARTLQRRRFEPYKMPVQGVRAWRGIRLKPSDDFSGYD
jgi:hypothetical protein